MKTDHVFATSGAKSLKFLGGKAAIMTQAGNEMDWL